LKLNNRIRKMRDDLGPVKWKRLQAAIHWEIELVEFEKMTKRQWALWKGWMKNPHNRKELLELVHLMNSINRPLQDMFLERRVH
jgi:hypothetical protein